MESGARPRVTPCVKTRRWGNQVGKRSSDSLSIDRLTHSSGSLCASENLRAGRGNVFSHRLDPKRTPACIKVVEHDRVTHAKLASNGRESSPGREEFWDRSPRQYIAWRLCHSRVGTSADNEESAASNWANSKSSRSPNVRAVVGCNNRSGRWFSPSRAQHSYQGLGGEYYGAP